MSKIDALFDWVIDLDDGTWLGGFLSLLAAATVLISTSLVLFAVIFGIVAMLFEIAGGVL